MVDEATIILPLEGILDFAAERERQEKNLGKLEREAGSLKGRLNNQGFVAKAPAHVIEQAKAELAEKETTIEKVKAVLARLG